MTAIIVFLSQRVNVVNLFDVKLTFLYCVNVTSALLERSYWKQLVWQVPHTNVIFTDTVSV